MKIRIIKPWKHEGKTWKVGLEVEVIRSYGIQLISDGYAEEVRKTKTVKDEDTTQKGENSTQKRKTKIKK